MGKERTDGGKAISPQAGRRIREVLKDDPDFLVPVKKLMRHFLRGLDLPGYDDFLAFLRAEPDLVVMDLEDKSGDGDWDEKEMEALGYYTGPRVRLRDRVPSPADIAEILKRHTDRMMESLGQAYSLGAGHFSEEEEDAMLAMLERAGKLKKSVDGIMNGKGGKKTDDRIRRGRRKKRPS